MSRRIFLNSICCGNYTAVAYISGGTAYPDVRGVVKFMDTPYDGIIIEAEVFNLPVGEDDSPEFFGFHIHKNGDCGDDFANTGGHYDRDANMHPAHTGDLIPLMSGDGYSWVCFYDSSLSIAELIGKSIIIHRKPDDFKTQPSGDSGDKIACGIIR